MNFLPFCHLINQLLSKLLDGKGERKKVSFSFPLRFLQTTFLKKAAIFKNHCKISPLFLLLPSSVITFLPSLFTDYIQVHVVVKSYFFVLQNLLFIK